MSIPHELAAACADVRLATTADVIAGRQARWVAAPGTTREAAAVLQTAAVLGLSVVPRGAGRLQHWGDPPDSCDLIIDTRRLNQIIEHLPGDFKVTVQAGVRVSDLEQAVEAARQTLAIPPPRRAYEGTVGGLIAMNAAGSHRYRYGTPRDRLIGITAIRVDGTILRSDQFTPNVGEQDLVRSSRRTRQPGNRASHLPPGAAGGGVLRRVAAVRRSRARGAARRDRLRRPDSADRDRSALARRRAIRADRDDRR